MNKEIAPVNNQIVMPAVDAKGAVEAWKQYEALKSAIVDKANDVQRIGEKDFLKKSYWRKLATFFNLSIEVIEEHHEVIGRTVVWHFTVKATAPNGRSAIGTGSCDAYEKAVLKDGKYMTKGPVTKWGKSASGKSYPIEWSWVEATPNSIHNIRSTAETRATNRAISNLVGGGEVSAEEVDQQSSAAEEEHTVDPTPTEGEPMINDWQKDNLRKLFKEQNVNEEEWLKERKLKSLDELTRKQAGDLLYTATMQKKEVTKS